MQHYKEREVPFCHLNTVVPKDYSTCRETRVKNSALPAAVNGHNWLHSEHRQCTQESLLTTAETLINQTSNLPQGITSLWGEKATADILIAR